MGKGYTGLKVRIIIGAVLVLFTWLLFFFIFSEFKEMNLTIFQNTSSLADLIHKFV